MQSSTALLQVLIFIFALHQACAKYYDDEKQRNSKYEKFDRYEEYDKNEIVKPGICVAPKREKICITADKECLTDKDCPGVAKCCASDCGLTCQKPPKTKPGQCLFLPFGMMPGCIEYRNECTYDTECPANMKCCETFCSRECQEPTVERPGTCPKLDIDPALVRCSRFDNECRQDNDCPTGLKCCKTACGFTCQMPSPSNEVCPSIDMKKFKKSQEDERPYYRKDGVYVLPVRNFLCEESCIDNNDCSGGQTCCGTSCKGGSICYDQQNDKIVKPGECKAYDPRQGITCTSYDRTCQTDMDCSANLKCCESSCGLTCQEPAGKAGTCPNYIKYSSYSKKSCKTKCTRDSQCEGDLKCCSNGCGTSCMKPEIIVKPGKCSNIFTRIACFEFKDQCKSDDECIGDEKCCAGPCGQTCQAPSFDKLGTCSSLTNILPPPCPRVPIDECVNDYNCNGDLKCCKNFCNLVCQKPASAKPGTCPAPSNDMISICVEACTDDSSCPGDEKCCSNGCGTSCINPLVITKPGHCSNIITKIGCLQKFDKCLSDGECTGNQKCCAGPCGLECQAPQFKKPGTCEPLNPNIVVRCSQDAVDQCQEDFECPDGDKCCRDYCSMKCKKPVPLAKSGSCPVPPKDIITTCDVTCSGDYSCPDDYKCCNFGCSIRCMKPVINVKPGECKAMSTKIACFKMGKDCLIDDDCDGDDKCCDGPCGLKCQLPDLTSQNLNPNIYSSPSDTYESRNKYTSPTIDSYSV